MRHLLRPSWRRAMFIRLCLSVSPSPVLHVFRSCLNSLSLPFSLSLHLTLSPTLACKRASIHSHIRRAWAHALTPHLPSRLLGYQLSALHNFVRARPLRQPVRSLQLTRARLGHLLRHDRWARRGQLDRPNKSTSDRFEVRMAVHGTACGSRCLWRNATGAYTSHTRASACRNGDRQLSEGTTLRRRTCTPSESCQCLPSRPRAGPRSWTGCHNAVLALSFPPDKNAGTEGPRNWEHKEVRTCRAPRPSAALAQVQF